MKKNFDAIVIGSGQSGPFLAAWPDGRGGDGEKMNGQDGLGRPEAYGRGKPRPYKGGGERVGFSWRFGLGRGHSRLG